MQLIGLNKFNPISLPVSVVKLHGITCTTYGRGIYRSTSPYSVVRTCTSPCESVQYHGLGTGTQFLMNAEDWKQSLSTASIFFLEK